jgi:hypothetical protein
MVYDIVLTTLIDHPFIYQLSSDLVSLPMVQVFGVGERAVTLRKGDGVRAWLGGIPKPWLSHEKYDQ